MVDRFIRFKGVVGLIVKELRGLGLLGFRVYRV